MITSRHLSAIAVAALLGAGGSAFAQNTSDASKASTTAAKPLCSSLNHPNAGKHADKTTGKAGEKSSSPVHADCIPDNAVSAATRGVNAAPSAATPMSPSTASSASTAATGASTDVNSSITGSTSTVSPTIDARGRSTVTIDNATTTGNQTLSTDTTTSAGTTSASTSSGASSSLPATTEPKKKKSTS